MPAIPFIAEFSQRRAHFQRKAACRGVEARRGAAESPLPAGRTFALPVSASRWPLNLVSLPAGGGASSSAGDSNSVAAAAVRAGLCNYQHCIIAGCHRAPLPPGHFDCNRSSNPPQLNNQTGSGQGSTIISSDKKYLVRVP